MGHPHIIYTTSRTIDESVARHGRMVIGGFQMRLRYFHIFGMFVLGVAFSGGQALGWWEPAPPVPKSPSKPDAAVKPETDPPTTKKINDKVKPKVLVNPKANLKARAKLKAKTQASRKAAAKKRKRSTSFTMNPDAKWACDLQTVKLEPVWRGDKALTFTFFIRNEGTADLQIKARGG